MRIPLLQVLLCLFYASMNDAVSVGGNCQFYDEKAQQVDYPIHRGLNVAIQIPKYAVDVQSLRIGDKVRIYVNKWFSRLAGDPHKRTISKTQITGERG